MKIKSAKFIISNSNYKICPEPKIPEYAFIGRSNVGKSSLINAIVNNKKLAKTSGKPGKTQLINHFLINNDWYLVDLPGFGYAKTSKTKRAEFRNMITNYLLYRKNLMAVFVLIDSQHDPQAIDQDFMQWLAEKEIPFVMVFTKSDKLGEATLENKITFYKQKMLKKWEELPQTFICSAVSKRGVKEISNYIENLNLYFRKVF
tara:strand:- start:40 stop:648 length:609 start_codon:yes stop_codon:yes gene_type:complete